MALPLAVEIPPIWQWIVLVASAAVAGGVLIAIGAFKRRDEPVIENLFGAGKPGPLLLNAGIAIAAYFGAAMLIGVVLRATDNLEIKDGEPVLSPNVLILFSVVVPCVTLVVLAFGLKHLVPGGARRIGLFRAGRGAAFLPALGYAAAAMPFILLIGNAAEVIYEMLDWHHPTEHPLLTSMDASGAVFEKVCAVLAAVVLAPLSEEILFRGHIQSAIRLLLSRRAPELPPPLPVMEQPAIVPSEAAAVATPVLPYAPPADARHTLASVAAVVVTSLIFASIHPLWSAPPIFVLALFLGFAYERRGNLWTCIFIHALFNGIMTTLFLFMGHPAP